MERAPVRSTGLDRRQGGCPPAGQANGADVTGPHEHDLLKDQVDVIPAPFADQLADLAEVVGGVAAESLDAALDEALMVREELQESFPLVGRVARVAGSEEPLCVLRQLGGPTDASEQIVPGQFLAGEHDREPVADLLAEDTTAGVLVGDLVKVVLPADGEVEVEPATELRSVAELAVGEGTQVLALLQQPVDRALMSGLLDAHVADLASPPAAVPLRFL